MGSPTGTAIPPLTRQSHGTGDGSLSTAEQDGKSQVTGDSCAAFRTSRRVRALPANRPCLITRSSTQTIVSSLRPAMKLLCRGAPLKEALPRTL